ncbi:hypothetical protein [Neorhizobium sp. DT-125]|uniref:hypothetical protein n=1 Tax=Neorhizobium sp. DT-125 TaxID=3396163 RepID=UPI003F1E373C
MGAGRKSVAPFAGSAGRSALLDPVLLRVPPVDVIKKETIIMTIIDHINELRAELNACLFSTEERAELEAELAALLAERDEAVKAQDALFEILMEAETR